MLQATLWQGNWVRVTPKLARGEAHDIGNADDTPSHLHVPTAMHQPPATGSEPLVEREHTVDCGQ